MARYTQDKELEQYRRLMEPPEHFEDGFTWKTVIGAIFLGMLIMPGSMYLSLVVGPETNMDSAARWVTIILFAEVARRSFKELKMQEIYIFYYMAGLAMASPFQGLLWNQYLVESDYANAMGSIEARALDGVLRLEGLYAELDGTFPHHEANPLKTETLADLQALVRRGPGTGDGRFDFGVAFDGDADRAGFVDETGAIVPMDMITLLIARSILQKQKGAILYDLRSSWAVREVIEEEGGTAQRCRVGHAFIKQQMREARALFAGELSGHYYFRENYFAESAALAVLHVANLVSQSATPLSALVRPFRRYFKSTELNSEVKDPAAALDRLRGAYRAGRQFELDGLSVEFDDWWFNVRCSNTEPLVRLNLEAKSKDLLDRQTGGVKTHIATRANIYGCHLILHDQIVKLAENPDDVALLQSVLFSASNDS